MSSHQEKSNETVMPVPDVTMVMDGKGEDEDVIDLEAVAKVAMAKLEKELAEVKARNERITQKKQEWADQLKKKKEEDDAAEVKQKAAKKVPVQPLVSLFCLSSWGQKLTWFPDWASSSTCECDGGAVQTQGEWRVGFYRQRANVGNRKWSPLQTS